MVATFILLTSLFIATITDLRSTEVPDILSYATIAAGIGLATLHSILNESITPFLSSIAGLTIYGTIGLSLFYLGQWGGGDAKLMIGAGALIGGSTNLLSPFIAYPISIMIMGGLYSLVWSSALAIRHRETIYTHLRKTYAHRGILTAQALLILTALLIVTGGVISRNVNLYASIILALAIPTTLVLFLTLKIVEKHCFRKTIPANKLMEGDWILHAITKNGKTLYTPKNIGITKEEIKKLQDHNISRITIKYGIPFVPALFLAYIPIIVLTHYGILVS